MSKINRFLRVKDLLENYPNLAEIVTSFTLLKLEDQAGNKKFLFGWLTENKIFHGFSPFARDEFDEGYAIRFVTHPDDDFLCYAQGSWDPEVTAENKAWFSKKPEMVYEVTPYPIAWAHHRKKKGGITFYLDANQLLYIGKALGDAGFDLSQVGSICSQFRARSECKRYKLSDHSSRFDDPDALALIDYDE